MQNYDHIADELVNSQEAAKILGVGVRMFQKIVSGGGVRPYKIEGKDRLYKATDIMVLKELREGDIGLHNLIIEARRSVIEARAMRHELDHYKAVLGINTPILRLDRDSVVAVAFRAEDDLKTDRQLTKEELLAWARTLHAVHEPYLEAIELYLNTKEPWRGILNLARKLCVEQPMELTQQDKELENIYALLHAGLRIARQAAYFYVRERHGNRTALRLFPEAKHSVHEDVLLLSYAT